MKCDNCGKQLKQWDKFYYITEGYVLEDGTGTPETGSEQNKPNNKIVCPACLDYPNTL